MPFASGAQRRFMYANHPNIAARWTREEKKMPAPGNFDPGVSYGPPPGGNAPKYKRRRKRRAKREARKYRNPTFVPDADGVGAVKPSVYRRPA